MRVPEDAGQGKVKVVLSFPAWTEGKVRPATLEVPLAEAAPPAKKQ